MMMKKLKELFKQLKLKDQIQSCFKQGAFLIFDIELLAGGTFKKIENHATEIALHLKALTEPLIYPITEKGIIRMELMVEEQKDVLFNDVVKSNDFLNIMDSLALALGRLRNGSMLVADLLKMPHLLVAGATGSGKSMILHSIINSLLVSNENVKLVLIDPKRVEFSCYEKLSNLYGPIAKDIDSITCLLGDLISEMENRFLRLEKSGARDISDYKGKMPYIVVVIDELSDLMMSAKKEMQEAICKLAQKSRACGIHLVVATQRPSVDIITGLIKANFPARICCQVSSSVDSRTVLDKNGAEKLTGKGDSILDCSGFKFKRFKGSFVTKENILENIKHKQSWWRKVWSH